MRVIQIHQMAAHRGADACLHRTHVDTCVYMCPASDEAFTLTYSR